MGQVNNSEPPVLRDLFTRVERYAYISVGMLLIIAAIVAVAGAMALVWHGMLDWTNTTAVFEVVDRLLFVLMLIEIMHTVSASIRTGGLTVEPFLIVGLIASIRRVLVITLETSEAMRGHAWTDSVSQQFHASMIELCVLGGLILVMVSSIFLLHRIPKESKQITS
ncbi:MAG: phosphate-starvation-inducible PsiE family protein [Acetobacteraceae bacterium]|nr:phosphate-starvation-inducible PsiE family protein [Acetobacteraceae bacterium]